MPVILARVDERLIHGQMALAWLRKYSVDMVIVVDDASANDPLQTMLLEMAVSGTIKCIVTTVAEAKQKIEENKRLKIFLCAKAPKVYVELLSQGAEIPEVNIGGIYNAPGRTQFYETVFIDDEIKADILALEQYPTKVDYRMVPNSPGADIIADLKKA